MPINCVNRHDLILVEWIVQALSLVWEQYGQITHPFCDTVSRHEANDYFNTSCAVKYYICCIKVVIGHLYDALEVALIVWLI